MEILRESSIEIPSSQMNLAYVKLKKKKEKQDKTNKLAGTNDIKIVKCFHYEKDNGCCSFILLRLESEGRDSIC